MYRQSLQYSLITNIIEACEQGKLDLVSQLLVQNPHEINCKGKLERTPVMVAAVTGQKELFDFLVRNSCDVSGHDERGDNLLHLACAGGNLDIIKHLLGQKIIEQEAKGRYGQTAVIKSAYYGHTEVYDFLVSKGCDVTVLDDNKDNVLHVACLGGNLQMVNHLLARKVVGMETRGQYRQSPVMMAARMGHEDIFRLLVDKSCRLSTIDDNGDNVLHMACIGGNENIVKFLVSEGIVNIESRGQYGKSPLMKAAEKAHRNVFDYLVNNGADMQATDHAGNSILHTACTGGDESLVKHIISMDIVSLEAKNNAGRTPIMVAVAFGQKGVFDQILNIGCDLTAVDNDNNNTLHISCTTGNVRVVDHVLVKSLLNLEGSGRYGRTPLLVASFSGGVDLFKFLVNKGCNKNVVDDEGNNAFHVASIGGNLAMVEYIVSLKMYGLESKGKLSRTSVMLAAEYGNTDVFNFLAKKGCDLSKFDAAGDTILHLACSGGSVSIVEFIVLKGTVDLDSKGKYGRTPIMKAAEKGNRDVLELLVDEGCTFEGLDGNNDNIVHISVMGGRLDMVDYFLSRGVCGLEARGKNGRTLLMKAVEFGHMDIFEFLVGEGSQLDAKDDGKDNLLHIACLSGNIDMVKRVLSLGVLDINSRGGYGRTAVMKTAERGHKRIFDLLEDRGCELKVADDSNDNILHVACLGGDLGMAKHLLKKNIVSIESRGKFGQTPIMKAAIMGHIPVYDLLVAEGADAAVVDDDGNKVFHVACIGGNIPMLEHLLSLDESVLQSVGKHGRSGLMLAAEEGQVEVFQSLVDRGCGFTAVDKYGDNILHIACLGGNLDMVINLIQRQVVNLESRGQYGETPLMKAARMGYRDIFDLLVSEGAVTSALNEDKDNILHIACMGGNIAMVKYLLSQKIADIESRGRYNQTPLMKAASMGHKGVFEFLVFEGSDTSVIDADGDNIFHVACYGGNVDIVLYLLTSISDVDVNKKNKAGQTPMMVAEACGNADVVAILSTES